MSERRAFLLVVLVAAFAFATIFYLINDQAEDLERAVAQNTILIEQLEAAVDVLCARGYIIDDLITAGILLIEQRLASDLASGNLASIRADRAFLNRFAENHLKLIRELTTKGSPCATLRS